MHAFLVEKPGCVVGMTCVCYFWAGAVGGGTLDTMIIGSTKVLDTLLRFTLPLVVLLPFLACLWKGHKQGE